MFNKLFNRHIKNKKTPS